MTITFTFVEIEKDNFYLNSIEIASSHYLS
jgi:hypothetical protein